MATYLVGQVIGLIEIGVGAANVGRRHGSVCLARLLSLLMYLYVFLSCWRS